MEVRATICHLTQFLKSAYEFLDHKDPCVRLVDLEEHAFDIFKSLRVPIAVCFILLVKFLVALSPDRHAHGVFSARFEFVKPGGHFSQSLSRSYSSAVMGKALSVFFKGFFIKQGSHK